MKKILYIIVFLPLFTSAQTGIISLIAGNGVITTAGSGDSGLAKYASVPGPYNMCFDGAGNMYIASASASVIRKVNTSGIVSTFAGTGVAGFGGDGGPAVTAQIYYPLATASDKAGSIYIADYLNNRVRKIDTAGNITSIAGRTTSGYSGDGGPSFLAELNYISDVATDKYGNVYVADKLNSRVRKIDTNGTITTVAGNGLNSFSGDGGPATNAALYQPSGITVDDTGNIYIADTYNNRIRKVNSAGIITTIAGYGFTGGFGGDGGRADSAILNNPYDVAIDRKGNIYFVDRNNYRIRKINTLGIISTVAGTGIRGYSGDGGLALNAQLSSPYGIAIDTSGNVYYADNTGHVRKITFTYAIGASPSDTVCPGTSITYSSNITSGCSLPVYLWKKNGTTVGSGGSSYVNAVAGGDTITCTLTCSGMPAVTSPAIVLPVRPANNLSVSIVSKLGDTICSDSLVVDSFRATTTGIGLTYQWSRSLQAAGTDSSIFVDTPANGELISCTISSSVVCTTPALITSNVIRMTVDTFFTPSVSINVLPDTEVCAGTLITLIATPVGDTGIAGGRPYKWLVNGTIATPGGGSKRYSYRPNNGDSIICVFTGGEACLTSRAVASNTINMIVDSVSTPSISISGPTYSTVGTLTTVTATLINAAPTYKIRWMSNSVVFATTTLPAIAFIKSSATEVISAEIVATTSGCYDSALSNSISIAPVGITSVYRTDIHFYPNPVNTVLHADNVSTETNYCLINLTGVVVDRGILHHGNNSIPMQNIPPGIYLFHMDGDPEMVKKVLKD